MHMRLRPLISCACALLVGCGDDEETAPPPGPYHHVLGSLPVPAAELLAEGNAGLYIAGADGIALSRDGTTTIEPLVADGLPRGHKNALLALQDDALVTYVWGKGLYRSTDGGLTFTLSPELPPYDLLASFVTKRAHVVPFGGDVDPSDRAHAVLAGPGGLYRTRDAGATWDLIEADAEDGKLYLFFLDAAVSGSNIVAAVQAPTTLLPNDVVDLIGRGVVSSADDGATWQSITGDLPARALTSVAIVEGRVYAGAMDGGLYRRDDAGHWEALGGPNDVVAISGLGAGVSVGSATRGVWRYEAAGWSQVGDVATLDLSASHALLDGGGLLALEPGSGTPPPAPAGGTVHLALSFHVNLYHSFRGDSNDEEGYGQDIAVIRNTLDWLDEYPEVHADWDMENHFSVDGWLAEDAPDIVERVAARVAAGQDQVRLMSWNNGAMSAETHEEFIESVERAKVSNTAAFGSFVPGVQPQENMWSPDHVGWYADLGIEWITLFNSQSPFTAFPLDHALPRKELYNPQIIEDGDDSMTLVPVYSHPDVFDRGGLRAWVKQIADTTPGDSLLVIHFDADGETWLNFDGELADLQELEGVDLRYTTIQTYLDDHPPEASLTLAGDQADGIGDGYQSWAEKDINHEVYTTVATARERGAWARALAPSDAGVADLLDDALTPRLYALSTTNFGLASPYLHPDREISARAYAADALAGSDAALAAAEATLPALEPGVVELVNARPSAGAALVEIPLAVPAAAYGDTDALAILDGATELPALVEVIDDTADPVLLRATVVVDLAAESTTALTWRYDPAEPGAMGGVAEDDLDPGAIPLMAPFTECFGSGRADAELTDGGDVELDERAVRASQRDEFDLALCDGEGTVARTLAVYDGLPGVVVTIDAEMGTAATPTDAESVALTPFECENDVASIGWQTFGGVARTRPARAGQETWNGQAADGWVVYECAGGAVISISHRVLERTSLAFSPLRNDQGKAIFAPLGTLWGDTPWHSGRKAGGIGVGDIVGIITPQFNPTAPDWSGKTIRYRLLTGEDLDAAVLDLFAHPPLVRVGAYAPPT
jgi:hypothetical protein